MSNDRTEYETFDFSDNRSVKRFLSERFSAESIQQVKFWLPKQARWSCVAHHAGTIVGMLFAQSTPGDFAFLHWPHLNVNETNRVLLQKIDRLIRSKVQVAQLSMAAENERISWLDDYFHSSADVDARLWVVPSDFDPIEITDLEFSPVNLDCPEDLERVYCESLIGSLDCTWFKDPRSFQQILETMLYESCNETDDWFLVSSKFGVVGCILISIVDRAAEILYFGAIPQERGKGWGMRILQFAKNWCYKKGAEFVLTCVDKKNFPATNLYDRHEFMVY